MSGGKSKTQVETPIQAIPPAEFNVKLDEASSIDSESRTSDRRTESHHSSLALDDSDDEQTTENVVHNTNTQTQSPHGQGLLSLNTSPRVRFRSRVRITGGIGRRRRLSEGLSSGASSTSGSPSSSISAPLRTNKASDINGWRPLGRRVSLLASQSDMLKGGDVHAGDLNGRHKARSGPDHADERSRLWTPPRHYHTTGQSGYAVLTEDEWREQVIQETFGKWPGRLLNRHWWWWQLEPIICCFCVCGDPEERIEEDAAT